MEKKEIVIASTNQGKIREFKEMLEQEGYVVKSLADICDMPEIPETGKTFEENAVIKAQAVTDHCGIMAIADDSGLSIDAFNGEPGIYSARYLGHDTSYEYKNRVILERMSGKTQRDCHYTCAIAVTRPNSDPVVFSEICACEIADAPKGKNGFGYDPIVYYPPLGKTMAEMTKDEKNAISHRGKALRKFEAWLNEQD